MWAAEDARRAELSTVTVADLVAELGTSVDPEQVQRGFIWLVEALS